MLRYITLIIGALVIFVMGLTAFSPISPVAWKSPDQKLASFSCEKGKAGKVLDAEVFVSDLPGTADGLTMTNDGRLFAGLRSGHVVEVDRESGQWNVIALQKGARILGVSVSGDGSKVYAADQKTSTIYEYDIKSGQYPVSGKALIRSFNDQRLLWINDVLHSKDNLYFTVTSRVRPSEQFRNELLEHRQNGSLARYDMKTGKTHEVYGKLYTANGLTFGNDRKSILVAETAAYQISMVSLIDGKTQVVAENLPGIPGNILRSDRDGVYWQVFASPRIGPIDRFSEYPFVRSILSWIPINRPTQAYPCALELTLKDGKATGRSVLFQSSEAMPTIASAIERDGFLYLSPHINLTRLGVIDRRMFRVKLHP